MDLGNSKDDLCIGCGMELTRSDGNLISEFLIDQSTGNTNMMVDGSVTPVVYKYKPPSNNFMYLTQLSFIMFDGLSGFSPEKFATINALSSGIVIRLNGQDYTKIKINADFELQSTQIYPALGSTTQPPSKISGKIDFKKLANDLPFTIFSTNGIEVIIQDAIDITGNYLYMVVHGTLRTLDV